MWNHFFDSWGNRINVASEVSPFHGLWLGCNENISKPQIKVLKPMESVWKLLWIFEFPKVWVKGVAEKVFVFCISSTFFVVGRWRCYAPTPAKNITVLPTDDYMAPWAQGLWGRGGASRDDLGAIRQMYLGSSGGCWWWLVWQFSTDFWMIEM